MEYAGYNVVVVNLFDCCHCKHGEWGCTNARRDFWRTHSVEKRKEQIHAQETYWKWKSKINVFIGAGAYDDMDHHLLPGRGGKWGYIGMGTGPNIEMETWVVQ